MVTWESVARALSFRLLMAGTLVVATLALLLS